MQKIQSFTFHLYCLVGPDAGTLFPLADNFTFLGRCTEPGDTTGVYLHDAQTSRVHVLLESLRFGVQVTDLGALNGTYWGKLFHPLPGMVRSWVYWRKLPVSGKPPQVLRGGDLLKIGQNIWQLRVCGANSILGVIPTDPLQKPGEFGWLHAGEGTAQESGFGSQSGTINSSAQYFLGLSQSKLRQLLFFILPLVSLTLLAFRFLPAAVVYPSLLMLGIGIIYGGILRLQRKRVPAFWEPAYICHLPVKTATKTGQAELILPPALQCRKILGREQLQRLSYGVKAHRLEGRWKLFNWGCGATSRRRVFCPPGVTVVEGNDASTWTLALALLLLLHLKVRGETPEVSFTASTVRVKTAENSEIWTFTSLVGSEQNVDLRLQFTCAAPFQGAAITQILKLCDTKAVQPELLTLETLRTMTKAKGQLAAALGNAESGGQAEVAHQGEVAGRAETTTSLAVPIGLDTNGNPYYLDLVAAGPHGIIAGTSGSGKSVALRTWLHQLCYTYTPQQLRLVLFDYKGGAALREFTSLPHVEGLVTDLVPKQAKRVLAALAAEVKDRENQLATCGFADITQWQRSDPSSCPPRIICVVDEYKVVSQTHPQDVETLLDLCARGRSLGIHLLLATQSAAGIVTGQMRANLNLKISFRTATVADSLDLLGTAKAYQMSQSGVSLLTDPRAEGELTQVQWAYSEPQLAKSTVVTASLWRPPLAEVIAELSEEYPQALMIADQFEQRRHLPVQWESGLVAVVAEEVPRQRILQTLCDTSWVNLQTYPASDWALRLHNAVAAGQVVVIADLHRFIGQLEHQFGLGTGREVWEEMCRASNRILVGVNPADFALVRLASQVLLHCSATQAKQLGVAAKLVAGLADLEAEEFLILRWPGVDAEFISIGLAVQHVSAAQEDPGTADVMLPKVPVGEKVELFTRQGAEVAAELVGRRFIDALYGEGVAGGVLEVKIVGTDNHIRNGESARASTSGVRAYYGLGATEIKALKLPYFLKNMAFYAEEIWVQNGVFWDRFTT